MVSYHFEAGLADLVEVLGKEQLLDLVDRMEPQEILFFHMLLLVAVAVVAQAVLVAVGPAVVVHRMAVSLEVLIQAGLLAQVFGQSLQQLFAVAKADFWPKICKP